MIDTEVQPVRLVQAEAVDNLLTLRFVTIPQKEFCFEADADMVLHSVESNQQVGICRAFYVEPGCVNFLVTLDYESPERLLLESEGLGLFVDYAVQDCGPWNGEVIVSRLRVERATLVRLPKQQAQPTGIILPLRPAKTWRWA